MKAISKNEAKQRKFLLLLPAIVLPFITIIFWALGGGKVSGADLEESPKAGFNNTLPGAKAESKSVADKMSYYSQANADSARLFEQMKNDPNYKQGNMGFDATDSPFKMNTSIYGVGTAGTSDEMEGRLKELQRLANTDAGQYQRVNSNSRPMMASFNGGEVDRLEQMMNSMSSSSGTDPEMDQLSGMLDKIMAIQNPEIAQHQSEQISREKLGKVYAVETKVKSEHVTMLEDQREKSDDGFYSDGSDALPIFENAIQAVVHETQTVVNGSTIKLRLINEITVNGKHIPENSFIYGQATLQGERLQIVINSVRYLNSLFPVQLTVFDLDGLDGIRIPDAISRKVAKEGADRGLQDIGLGALGPSWAAQAAGSGLEVATSFLSKKTKLVRVTVKSGYKILLRDDKQKNDPVDQIKF